MQNILFDARHLANQYSGLGRYTCLLLDSLLSTNEKYNNLVVILNVNDDKNEDITRIINRVYSTRNAKVIYSNYKTFSFSHYFKMHKIINKFEDYVYFYPHFDLPFFLNIRSKFVVHDLFPLVVKGYIVKFSIIKKIVFYLLCANSFYKSRSQCFTISNSTKNDIYRLFPFVKNVSVVLSAPALTSKVFLSNNIDFSQLGKPFLFYIGDRRPHKNLKKAIDIFRVLSVSHKYKGSFIIAGSTKNFDFDLDSYVKQDDNIKLVGNLTEEELVSFYANMDALFFISKYEGFGLPILEAARFNKKIISSNISALPEVSPTNSLLLELDKSTTESAIIINDYLSADLEIDNSAFLNKFSWDITAKKIFDFS